MPEENLAGFVDNTVVIAVWAQADALGSVAVSTGMGVGANGEFGIAIEVADVENVIGAAKDELSVEVNVVDG